MRAQLKTAQAEIKRLSSKLAEANSMLESLTGPAAPKADTKPESKTPSSTPKAATTTPPPAKERPTPTPTQTPLQKLKSGECRDISSLLDATKGAIALICGKNGLPKKAIREICDALTGIPDLERRTHTARTSLVKALADLKEKGGGDNVPEPEVQKFLRTVDSVVSSQT